MKVALLEEDAYLAKSTTRINLHVISLDNVRKLSSIWEGAGAGCYGNARTVEFAWCWKARD